MHNSLVMMRIIMVEVKVKSMMMNRVKSRCYLSLVSSFIFSQNICRIIITAKLQNLTTEGALLLIFVKSSGKTKEMQENDNVYGECRSQCLSPFKHTPKERATHSSCKVDQDCELIELTTH